MELVGRGSRRPGAVDRVAACIDLVRAVADRDHDRRGDAGQRRPPHLRERPAPHPPRCPMSSSPSGADGPRTASRRREPRAPPPRPATRPCPHRRPAAARGRRAARRRGPRPIAGRSWPRPGPPRRPPGSHGCRSPSARRRRSTRTRWPTSRRRRWRAARRAEAEPPARRSSRASGPASAAARRGPAAAGRPPWGGAGCAPGSEGVMAPPLRRPPDRGKDRVRMTVVHESHDRRPGAITMVRMDDARPTGQGAPAPPGPRRHRAAPPAGVRRGGRGAQLRPGRDPAVRVPARAEPPDPRPRTAGRLRPAAPLHAPGRADPGR